ncbi:MAG: helix-turn-helix transcriptional regulator [Alphaproteobacteria bacterium]
MRLIPEPDAANILGVSISWMQRSRHTGEGPPYVKIKHAVRYRESDIEAFIEARIKTSTSDQGGSHA